MVLWQEQAAGIDAVNTVVTDIVIVRRNWQAATVKHLDRQSVLVAGLNFARLASRLLSSLAVDLWSCEYRAGLGQKLSRCPKSPLKFAMSEVFWSQLDPTGG